MELLASSLWLTEKNMAIAHSPGITIYSSVISVDN